VSEIDQIIHNYKPERVILFGSRANGTHTEDSDYDFLIIKETATRRLNRREEAMRGISQHVPMDLIILTPEEMEFLQQNHSQFIEEILNEGKILYERQ